MLFDLPTTESVIQTATAIQNPKISPIEVILEDVFGTIKQGYDYPFATGALWSTHDLMSYILRQIGPAHIVFATWSVATSACDRLISMQSKGEILSISALVDWRVQVRTPGVLTLAKHMFSNIKVSSCHAKAFVMQNDDWNISIVGLANLTNNPRIECGHLSTSATVADFHKSWILAEINNSKPFGMDMRKLKKDGRI